MRSVVDISRRRPGFDSQLIYVGFLVEKIGIVAGFSFEYFGFSLLLLFPPRPALIHPPIS
jgi:hypothetical protein